MIYSILRQYSPLIDGMQMRISVADARGGEFFKLVAVPERASEYKRVRDEVLDEIEAAIGRGDEPGEVCG